MQVLLLASALVWSGVHADAQTQAYDLVPEMETPEGIEVAPRSERAALSQGEVAEDVVRRVETRIAALWPAIRDVDLVALSKFQVEETKGYELPERFDDWQGRVIGRGDDGLLFVELRGPRLPAKYDIVFRYLTVYAGVDPGGDAVSGSVGRPVVTIRGWIEE